MSALNITKNNFQEEVMNSDRPVPVSYTHLDVYKRQVEDAILGE